MNNLEEYFSTIADFLKRCDEDFFDNLKNIIELIKKADRIIICGNGGSAATAMHMATDFEKNLGLAAFSLVENQSTITAYANDYDYNWIFSTQLVKFKLTENDLVIGISGSGESYNVINAITYANTCNAMTLGITGFNGGRLKQYAKYNIHIPLNNMQMVEDIHSIINHVIVYDLWGKT